MLPQLRRLEEQFHDELVVIGVHSPKFPAERDLDNLHAAILALELDHPVVGDPDHRLWDQYAVRAWPTLMFVDPYGRVIGKHEGELHFPMLGELVGRMLDQYRSEGAITRDVALPLQPEAPPAGLLAFPGKVVADAATGRLVISDTGHHRVIVAQLDEGGQAAVRRAIGGERGFADGVSQARFDAPQGLALAGDTLYVADSNNHALRRIDLATGEVTTIAGTGMQAERFHRGGAADEVALSSPWDLALSTDHAALYVAMAGFHQVWALDLDSRTIYPFSGTGHEGIKDETRARAWHAQPQGLALDGATLYVADSETSAVRAVDVRGQDGGVMTLTGSGLFDFGDQDGPGLQARMQHVQALCATPDALWVADSYNSKLRKIDRATGWVSTAAGTGEHGFKDGIGASASLWEPSGLGYADGKIYVADTFNHAIRVFDPRSGELSTVRMV